MSTISIRLRRRMVTSLIDRAQGRFCGITFVKKDGTVRHLTIQTAAVETHTTGCKTAAARQGVAKRRINHPNLFPVYDVAAGRIKSINLDTVTHVNVDKTCIEVGVVA